MARLEAVLAELERSPALMRAVLPETLTVATYPGADAANSKRKGNQG
jgi:hypothetical protein